MVISASSLFAAVNDTTYKVLTDTATLNGHIRTYSKNLQTIESNFVQMKTMSVLRTPSKSVGYFCFKNPGMVRWEYTDPFKYLVVINNNRLYMTDDNKTKSFDMTSTKSFVVLTSNLGKLLQGSVFDNKSDFSCSYYENDNTYKLILTPKVKTLKAYFSNIVLYFDKKNFSVSRVVMLEIKGDKTEIIFNDRKINEGISDDKFTKPK